VTDRVDISSMTDAERADMYEAQRRDMINRQPTAGEPTTPPAGGSR